MTTRCWVAAVGAMVLAGCAGSGLRRASDSPNRLRVRPQYTDDGRLVRPTDYRTWMFIAASIGMSYDEKIDRKGPGRFHNIYIQPGAYRQYRDAGTFPEGTMLAMEVFDSASHESINKHGYFEGARVSVEVAVKDGRQFEDGWAYFDFPRRGQSLAAAARALPKDRCYDCHRQHGADDNVFVQFYPGLRDARAGRNP